MLRFCYLLFVVSPIFGGSPPIDPAIFDEVFHNYHAPMSFQPASGSIPMMGQAIPVTPANTTLVDYEYWDPNAETPDDDFKPSTAEYDRFDWTVTRRLAAMSSENNFLLSPLGLKMALAILTEAASGATQMELQSVLGFDRDRFVTRRKFATIISSLQAKSEYYIMDFGSRIYVGDVPPRQKFASIALNNYKTDVKNIDFSNVPAAAQEINNWVSGLTHGKINNLVAESDLPGTAMIILNALYFKGTWRHQFLPNMTKMSAFYVSPKTIKNVQFMNIKSTFFYAESQKLDAKILRMPYLGKRFSMYLVVPNTLTGLSRVMEGVPILKQEMASLRELNVAVSIPKWNFDFGTLLDGILKDLGIRQIFEDTASLPGISRGQLLKQRLKVSKILQRTGIDVNELGTEAYAATEIQLENKFGDDDSLYEVKANKPFLFFIEDETTRQLLFTGRLVDPTLNGANYKS